MYNPEFVLEKEMHKLLWDFDDTTGSPNIGQTTWPSKINKKKRTWRIGNFAVLADLGVKLKKAKRRISTWTLLRKWKNVKVTVIPIVTGVLDTITKGLIKGQEYLEIQGWVEAIKT